jgi:hypothetical protein
MVLYVQLITRGFLTGYPDVDKNKSTGRLFLKKWKSFHNTIINAFGWYVALLFIMCASVVNENKNNTSAKISERYNVSAVIF